MKLKKLFLVLFAAYLVFLFASCQSGKEPVQTPAATTTAFATTLTTPPTTAATTEPVQTTTTTSATTAATTTEPPVTTTAPDAFVFSEFRPWEWWDLPETVHLHFGAAHQSLNETEPLSILRVLGEDAYVPLEPLAEKIVADTYNSVYVQFWDVSETHGREIHTAQMYTDDVMRQMILADRGQFWRIESEALYEYFTEQALNFGRIWSTLVDPTAEHLTMQISLCDAGQTYPVITMPNNVGYLGNQFSMRRWIAVEQEVGMTAAFAVSAVAADGSELTLFAETELARWKTAEGENWYRLDPKNPVADWSQGDLAAGFREFYYSYYFSVKRIEFSCDGTAEDVVAAFVNDYFAELLLSVPQGTWYSTLDYTVLEYSLYGVRDDGNTVTAGFTYAALPEDIERTHLLVGNGRYGTDEYEGWVIASRSFRLVRGEDGLWRCDEMATGGLE